MHFGISPSLDPTLLMHLNRFASSCMTPGTSFFLRLSTSSGYMFTGRHLLLPQSISPSTYSGLVSYTYIVWAGCLDTRRSNSRYCGFDNDTIISWYSKRQHVISRSSVEAEYRGVANFVVECSWIRNLLLEHHCLLTRGCTPTTCSSPTCI